MFIDPVDQLTFLGGFKWTRSDQRDSVQVLTILGSGRFNQSRNFNNVNVLDLGHVAPRRRANAGRFKLQLRQLAINAVRAH